MGTKDYIWVREHEAASAMYVKVVLLDVSNGFKGVCLQ
jgi:hypothetical protein